MKADSNREYDSLKELSREERLERWPSLRDGSFVYMSDFTINYNCAAWVVHETERRIDSYGYWWPDDVPVAHTAESYAEVYRKHFGFENCEDGSFETGIEKIAIFSDANKLFTHAARQKENGIWTSKMGDCEDIDHGLDVVAGGWYGQPVLFLKKIRET